MDARITQPSVMDVDKPNTDKSVEERVRDYLAKKEAGRNGSNGGNGTFVSSTNNSMYSVIKNKRVLGSAVPNLNGKGAALNAPELGSFYNEGDRRIELAFLRSSFNGNLNVSFSFNPSTLQCSNCSDMPHNIAGVLGQPDVFILTDQNFAPALPTSGKKCVNVIRVEYGTLTEIANIFLDVISVGKMHVGSVIIISSASQLADIGLAGYAEEMVRASKMIMSSLSGQVTVRAGIPVLLNGCSDPNLIRSISELGGWLSSLREAGEGFPASSMEAVILSIKNSGRDGLQTPYTQRFRLPVSLLSYEKKTWGSGGWIDLPNGTTPLGFEAEKFIVDSLVAELNLKFNFDLDPEPNLSRADPNPRQDPPAIPGRVITVGASLADRLASAMSLAGIPSTRIPTPSWRPTQDTMARAAAELSSEINNDQDVTIIFQFLDCAAFYARCEDGGLVPARQGHNEDGPDGSYHLDGELVIAPRELFNHTLKTALTLFKAAGSHHKIILAPLPRYWVSNCCSEVDHIPNRMEEDFEDIIFDGIDGLRRLIKDFLFLHKIPNCSVYNTAQLIVTEDGGRSTSVDTRTALKARWGSDPVHPEEDCFSSLAANILKKLSTTIREAKQKAADLQPSMKRTRWLDTPGVDTVSPTPTRGRGYGMARGGRGGRGWRGRPKFERRF